MGSISRFSDFSFFRENPPTTKYHDRHECISLNTITQIFVTESQTFPRAKQNPHSNRNSIVVRDITKVKPPIAFSYTISSAFLTLAVSVSSIIYEGLDLLNPHPLSPSFLFGASRAARAQNFHHLQEFSTPRNVTSIHSLIHGVLGRWLAEPVVIAVALCTF